MESLLTKYLQIFSVVVLYWVVSIVTVFINKALLSSKEIDLEAPLFMAWFQCLISALICFTISCLATWCPGTFYFPKGSPFRLEIMKKVLPLSILFAAMISFNNLCLKYVGVAFYYIGRSLTTVFNVLFTYLILGQTTSLPCIICCIIIIVGFWLGVDQEHDTGSFSSLGTAFGILGSLSLALYSIHTKKVLPALDQEIWLLSYYNNLYSCFIFLPFIVATNEVPVLLSYDKFTNVYFWGLMIIGGFCGFAIGYVTSLQIKVTSPLTHNISGTAKACAQTVIATYWYQDSKSWLWWVSNWIVLGGSAAYTSVRQREIQRNFNKQNRHQTVA